MSDSDDQKARRFTIGQLARQTGLTVKTIRWYSSDQGLVPPCGRSPAGYRLYDLEALARLQLVRTLRAVGLDLATIGRVLAREVRLAEVAAIHAEALDAQIRTLWLHRAVLRALAARDAYPEEVELVHRLARLSEQERRRIITDFVDEVFEGLPADPDVGAAMRQALPDLPAEPTPEQVAAWIELAELVGEPGFRRRIRSMAEQAARWRAAGEQPHAEIARWAEVLLPKAGAAMQAGVDPAGPEAAPLLAQMLAALAQREGRVDDPAFRARVLERLEVVADARLERYWDLLGVINRWPPGPLPTPLVPRCQWVIAALRAQPSPAGQTKPTTPEAAP
jgi:DNA-binding transcriptional MerR regulator